MLSHTRTHAPRQVRASVRACSGGWVGGWVVGWVGAWGGWVGGWVRACMRVHTQYVYAQKHKFPHICKKRDIHVWPFCAPPLQVFHQLSAAVQTALCHAPSLPVFVYVYTLKTYLYARSPNGTVPCALATCFRYTCTIYSWFRLMV
jgi:hypothetical protein